MCEYEFNDGANHRYSLKQLESYSKIQVPFHDDTSLGSDNDSVDPDNKSEELDSKEDARADDTDSENESSDDGQPFMNRKYFQKLVSIPSGMSTSQRLNEPSARRSTRNLFKAVIAHPVNQIKEQFEALDLDGRPVTVHPFPGESDFDVFDKALK